MARINKLTFDATDYAIGTEYFGYCTSSSTTNAKVITTLQTTGFGLNNGTILHVVFSNNHTSGATMQLNVNSTGEKNVMNKAGKYVSYLPKGYYSFVYYNNLWYMNGKAYEDLQVSGIGNAIASIDALDWTNGIKATKGYFLNALSVSGSGNAITSISKSNGTLTATKSYVEAYHSTPLSQVASTDMSQLTGSGSLSSFWLGESGDTIEIAIGSGELNFNAITSSTASRNRRFHIYVFGGEFKMYGCYTNINTSGVIIADKAPVLLKCWRAQITLNTYAWMVEVTYFSYRY